MNLETLRKYLTQALASIRAFRDSNPVTSNLIAAGLVTLMLVVIGTLVFNPGAPVVLVANLGPADRTALALRLRRHEIPFQLGNDSIVVASRDLSQAQRILDASPGFSGGDGDFGLFDHSTLGQSDFDEQVKYQRSLQGELERTIMSIRGIDNARVMLAIGRPSPFALGQAEASHASVMLTLSRGAVADPSMVRAIAHLVAGSVRGLKPEDITVTGSDGDLLYPTAQNNNEMAEEVKLRNDIERRLQDKLSSLLGPVMGQGRYAVAVSVELDTSQQQTREKIYGTGDNTILSEERSVQPAGSQIGGIPGLTSNLPTPVAPPSPVPTGAATPATAAPAPTANPEYSRKDIVNYKPSLRETESTAAKIRIHRISVAAVLDGTYEGGAFKPLPPERLQSIKGLVAAAIGAQSDRGDSIDVQSAALTHPYVPPAPDLAIQVKELVENHPVYLYSAIGTLVTLLLVVGWGITKLLRRKPKKKNIAIAAAEQIAVLADAAASESGGPSKSTNDFDHKEIRRQANIEAERDPEATAALIRRWISSDTVAANGNGNGNGKIDGHGASA